tara:strand:+ start:511 stop:699 length:189 start_codon:yes stop_codon:yes gene_type:complete
MVKKNFSDDSFDKIFDVEYIKNSIKKDSFTTYILIGLLVFGILSIMITIFLHYNGKKKEELE